MGIIPILIVVFNMMAALIFTLADEEKYARYMMFLAVLTAIMRLG